MKCHDVQEELIAYIDGELSPMGRHAIEAHLTECHDCTVKYEELRKTVDWTHQVKPIQPTQDWWEQLQERLHASQSEPDLSSEIRAVRESIACLEGRIDQYLGQFGQVREIMTLEEVAVYLQIESEAVWNLINEIPHFEVGYELRFKKTSVDKWIQMKENGGYGDSSHWNVPMNWLDRFTQLEP